MKIPSFTYKFVMFLGLLFACQVFAAECAANYVAPENAVWDGTSTQEPCTVDGYYIIDNAKKLAWYAKNYKNANARLTADIDLGDKLWTPIAAGKGGNVYGKIFDGNGHVVKNLYINATELAAKNKDYAQNLGFIAVLGGGTVKNLILENVDIQAATNAGDITGSTTNQISVGAVVGWLADKAKINNKDVVLTKDDTFVIECMASGTIRTTGKGQGVGGIVGNAKVGTISSCLSLVEIHTSGSEANIGGIIGITKTDVAVESCVYAGPGLYNTGTNGSVGGVVGNVYSGTASATDSYFEGNLTYNGASVGGVGKNCNNNNNCTNETVNGVTNKEDVACALNGTNDDGSCKEEPWSVGQTSLSLNGYGADGYKIIFNANEGTFAGNAITKNIFLADGMTISDDEVGKPSRDGYSFEGWAATADATVPLENLGTVSGSTKFYAVWAPLNTITFNVAPGSFPDGNVEKTKLVAKGQVITVEGLGDLPMFYCEDDGVPEADCDVGHYFTGWKLSGKNVKLEELTATGNLVLNAVWETVKTYTVTYNANEHGVTTVSFVRVGENEKVQKPTDPVAADGYEFDDWYTEPECQNAFTFNEEINHSYVLYAKWELKHFDITYVMNNVGSKGENPDKYTIDTAFVLKAPAEVEGYKFDGWFYDAGFTKPATQVIQGTTGNISLYAKWSKKTYRIMYLADNQSQGAVTDQFKDHGETITLESAGYFNRKGYVQTGWATVAEGAKVYEFGATYEENAALTLYPSWEIVIYNITYVCDVCTESNPSKPRTYTINNTKNGNYTLYNPTFSSNEYEFVGWFWDQAYTQRTTNIPKGMVGDTVLYGKMLKKYTITYELNGGTKANSRVSYTSETETFALGEATGRDGYAFDGWYTNEDFEGDAVTEIPKGSTGDITLYAKWLEYPILIATYGGIEIYQNEDGTTSADIDATSKVDIPAITDVDVSAVTFNRNFEVGARSTIMLPFSISVDNVSGGEFYTIAKMLKMDGKWTVGISKIERGQNNSLDANTPYIVITNSATLTFNLTSTVTLNNNTMNPVSIGVYECAKTEGLSEDENLKKCANTAPLTEPDAWTFKGTYQYKVFGQIPEFGSAYGFSGEAKPGITIGSFVRGGSTATIRPLRAYLVYNGSQSSSKTASLNYGSAFTELPDEVDVVVLDEQGNVAERGVMNTVTGQIRMDRWYDLQGRKLNSEPKTQGTYYHNGKRVIVK